jgi:hypothetical protein
MQYEREGMKDSLRNPRFHSALSRDIVEKLHDDWKEILDDHAITLSDF